MFTVLVQANQPRPTQQTYTEKLRRVFNKTNNGQLLHVILYRFYVYCTCPTKSTATNTTNIHRKITPCFQQNQQRTTSSHHFLSILCSVYLSNQINRNQHYKHTQKNYAVFLTKSTPDNFFTSFFIDFMFTVLVQPNQPRPTLQTYTEKLRRVFNKINNGQLLHIIFYRFYVHCTCPTKSTATNTTNIHRKITPCF